MIYLTRTTIETDGTHTTEIAVLEDDKQLASFTARGYLPVPYEVYRAAWRAKHTRIYERQLAAGTQTIQAPNSVCCPECSCDKVTIFVGGQRRCQRCQNNW